MAREMTKFHEEVPAELLNLFVFAIASGIDQHFTLRRFVSLLFPFCSQCLIALTGLL